MQNSTLKQFSIYAKTDECNYDVAVFNNLNKLESGELQFNEGEFVSFKNCKFHQYHNLSASIIQDSSGLVFLKQNNITINYQFSLLQKAYKEQLGVKSFKTFYQKVKLLMEFSKFNIPNLKLKQEVLSLVGEVISFFYVTLLSFAFFSRLPPRRGLFVRFFLSVCILITIHLVNLVITNWLIQVKILNPILFLAFPVVVFFILLTFVNFKRV